MNLLLLLLLISAVVAGWYLFEGRWDRRLFALKPGQRAENIRPQAAAALLAEDPSVQVLDVRSAREFSGGALPGAVNISMGDPDFQGRLAMLDPQKPTLVYCAGGYRSRKAVEILREQGFAALYHLHRGFMSWRAAGLPSGSRE